MFKELNIHIEEIIPTPLSSALATLNRDDKDLGAICIDLGESSTSISIFNGSDAALNHVLESILDAGDYILKYEPDYSQVDTFISMKGGQIIRVYCEDPFQRNIEIIH